MRSPLIVAALAALALATGCAASTSGTGTGVAPVVTSPSSAPGLPTAASSVRATFASVPPSLPPTSTASAPAPSVVSSVPAPSSAAVQHPVPSEPIRTIPVSAPDGRHFSVKIWAQVVSDGPCTGVSYGAPVTDFLASHPCARLDRILATTVVDGRAVGFAQSTVEFQGPTAAAMYRAAGEFRTLVSRNGTGNIDDLFRDGYRLPSGPQSVPYPDAFLAQAQDNTTTVDDLWYLHGPTPANDPPLVELAREMYLQVG